MTTLCRQLVVVPSGPRAILRGVQRQEDDDDLIWRLANGDGAALEPLMERWADPIADTCFRVLRDAERAWDLYGEVWAEVYVRIRVGTEPLPKSFALWVVGVVGDVVRAATREGRVPIRARLRMKLSVGRASAAELARLDSLRDPAALRAARAAAPRDFSAAADRMLLRMPEPTALSRIQLHTGSGAE